MIELDGREQTQLDDLILHLQKIGVKLGTIRDLGTDQVLALDYIVRAKNRLVKIKQESTSK